MKTKTEIAEYNRAAWNGLVAKGDRWTVPVSPEEIQRAKSGDVRIVLTPTKLVPTDWLMPLKGKDVLCLAGGGGQQAPLLAAAGANVTTLDNSPRQLEQDQLVAKREGLSIRSVLGRMDDLSELDDESFDLIVHPCSNCFTPNVNPVWQEAFRVTRLGGTLIAGFGNPIRFLFDDMESEKGHLVVRYRIPYSDLTDLDQVIREKYEADGEPLAFGHSLDDQIGGQLRAGFSLAGFYEDKWTAEKDPLSNFIESYMATRAVKT